MADVASRLDLYALGRDYITQRAKRLDPAVVDIAGSDANLFVGSSSVLARAVVNQLLFRINALLLDGAEGDDLDRYAFDRYQLVRKGASAALGTARFSRTSAAAGAGNIPIGTKLQTLKGAEYITLTTATFGALQLDNSFAVVRATQAGKTSQAGANSVRKFANVSALFDQSLAVNNDAATAGGEEVEDDDTFKVRIRTFWRTARRGILAAIEFGALTVPGVTSAQAIEVLNSTGEPARIVQLFISDSSGVASDALGEQVKTALLDYRAGGIAVIIATSLPQIVTVSMRLSFRAGVDTSVLRTNIVAAVVSFINSLPVNGALRRGELFSILTRFREDGLIINEGSIITPVGDLIPDVGKTLRTTLTSVTTVT